MSEPTTTIQTQPPDDDEFSLSPEQRDRMLTAATGGIVFLGAMIGLLTIVGQSIPHSL